MKVASWVTLASIALLSSPALAQFAWDGAGDRGLVPMGYITVSDAEAKNIKKSPGKFFNKEVTGDVFPLMGQLYLAHHPSILVQHHMNRYEWPRPAGPPPSDDERFIYHKKMRICQVLAPTDFSYYKLLVSPSSSDFEAIYNRPKPYKEVQRRNVGKTIRKVQEKNHQMRDEPLLRKFAGYENLDVGRGYQRAPTLKISLYERDKAPLEEVSTSELEEVYEPFLYGAFTAEDVANWYSLFTIICDKDATDEQLDMAEPVQWLLSEEDVQFESTQEDYLDAVSDYVETADRARAEGQGQDDGEEPDEGDAEEPDEGDVQEPDEGDIQEPDEGNAEEPDEGGVEEPDRGDAEEPDEGDPEEPAIDDEDLENPDDGGEWPDEEDPDENDGEAGEDPEEYPAGDEDVDAEDDPAYHIYEEINYDLVGPSRPRIPSFQAPPPLPPRNRFLRRPAPPPQPRTGARRGNRFYETPV